MPNWGSSIVVAEPANPAARLARYLAPKPHLGWRIEEEPVVPMLVVLSAGAVLGVLGRGVGALAEGVVDGVSAAEAWLAFDVILVFVVASAYGLTARYGIRFPQSGIDGIADAVRVIVVQGNAAWRALPSTVRKQHRPTVRALNSAARLLLVDSSDQQSKAMLSQHVQTLRDLATRS
ncbi:MULTISPECIES: hypothetical protein [Streptomyces griseus group]|uniref:hypothetical protein n=1 Tax=Streptomyces griseus group TaxID=629295 RepID=UPI0036BEE656